MFEESAKNLIRQLIKDGVVTDNDLEKYDFLPQDIEVLKSDRNWECLYDKLRDFDYKKSTDKAVAAALGDDWKKNYEYKEHTNRSGFGLWLKVNRSDYDKICEAIK